MNVAVLGTVGQDANSTSSATGLPALILFSIILPLVIALIGGGVVTAVFQDRHQRIKDLRESWLKASDAFLTAATGGLVALRQLKPQEDKPSGSPTRLLRRYFRDELGLSDRKDWMKSAGDNVTEATEKLRLIQLLFGPNSLTAQAGMMCAEQLEKARISIDTYDKTISAIAVIAAQQVDWRQLIRQQSVLRQAASQQAAARQMASDSMRRSWGIEWLRDLGLRFARWLLVGWRRGTRWLRWNRVAPPQGVPAEVASESQESRLVNSVLQGFTNLVGAVSPLIQPALNTGGYVKRYKDQRTLKGIQQAAEMDYEKAVGEAEKSLGEFVKRVSEEIDRLQRPPWAQKKEGNHDPSCNPRRKGHRESGYSVAVYSYCSIVLASPVEAHVVIRKLL